MRNCSRRRSRRPRTKESLSSRGRISAGAGRLQGKAVRLGAENRVILQSGGLGLLTTGLPRLVLSRRGWENLMKPFFHWFKTSAEGDWKHLII